MKVLFFGQLAERLGREREAEVPAEGCTVAELRRVLASSGDQAAELLAQPGIRAAVDQEMVGDEARVRPGQEVAFFSPVSGG